MGVHHAGTQFLCRAHRVQHARHHLLRPGAVHELCRLGLEQLRRRIVGLEAIDWQAQRVESACTRALGTRLRVATGSPRRAA